MNPNSDVTVQEEDVDMAAVISFLNGRKISYVLTTRDSRFDYYQSNHASPAAHPAGSSAAVASRPVPSTTFKKYRAQLTKVLSNLYQFNVSDQNLYDMDHAGNSNDIPAYNYFYLASSMGQRHLVNSYPQTLGPVL